MWRMQMFSLLSRFTSAFHGLAMLVGKKINWGAVSFRPFWVDVSMVAVWW